jgi:hypothetical protein
MLAYVLTAAYSVRVSADVEILDRCRTPLIACEWYSRWCSDRRDAPADMGQHSLAVHEMDVLHADRLLTSQYDLITTDAYLTRFEPSDAREVIRIWHRLLRPGGSVVTTVRLHPLDAPRGAILDEVSDFTLRAQEAAGRWRRYLQAGIDELTTAARQYAVSMRSYDLGDAAAVTRMLISAGFKIECSELGAAHGELRPVTYLRVVATKPAAGGGGDWLDGGN